MSLVDFHHNLSVGKHKEKKKIISCIPEKRVASPLGADVININIPIREGPCSSQLQPKNAKKEHGVPED